MSLQMLQVVFIPFLGTALGSACVFLMKNQMGDCLKKSLSGFAAGVMVAASVWSLLIPAMESAQSYGKFAFAPAIAGFWAGILFLLVLDNIIPHMHTNNQKEGPKSSLSTKVMLVFAVTLHNIPEGMAVGVVFAGFMAGNSDITAFSALALAIGIAIQNFPEGAIVSMPLRSAGLSKAKAFTYGALSGLVEPLAALFMIFFAEHFIPAMPYLLSFAAGAMIYVVVEELIPDMSEGRHSNVGTLFFAVGFSLMMALDIALG